jgi:hypothetical protein
VLVLALGTALTTVPIGALRLVVGSLLLVFGLQWLGKGIARVSANGFQGMGERPVSAEGVPGRGMDWTAFVLSFKGVLLEGLLVGTLLSSFGTFWAAEGLGWRGRAATPRSSSWSGGTCWRPPATSDSCVVARAASLPRMQEGDHDPALAQGLRTLLVRLRHRRRLDRHAAWKPGSGCDGNGLILRLKVNALHQ